MEIALLTAAVLAIPFLSFKGIKHWVRNRGKITLFQWGRFTNTRTGVKNSAFWSDEPDIVEYTDYKYWIRLHPNPGVLLPWFGYWSSDKGRKGP